MRGIEKLDVTLNQEKTQQADLVKRETFSFLRFNFIRSKTLRGKWSEKNNKDVSKNKTF